MPDRILRAELLTSEGWLALKNNDDRVSWIVLFLSADVFGNQPAGPHRLVHLWRHAGIDTAEKASKVLIELGEVDLLRCYQVDGKPYCHIPRFRQSRRYLGKTWPLSPWTTYEDKQRIANKPPEDHSEAQETARVSPVGVGVGVGVGVDLLQNRGASIELSTSEHLLTKWWLTEEGTKEKAVRLGFAIPAGMSYAAVRHRLFAMVREGRTGTALDSITPTV
jgi:hypothetical protein